MLLELHEIEGRLFENRKPASKRWVKDLTDDRGICLINDIIHICGDLIRKIIILYNQYTLIMRGEMLPSKENYIGMSSKAMVSLDYTLLKRLQGI